MATLVCTSLGTRLGDAMGLLQGTLLISEKQMTGNKSSEANTQSFS